MERPAILGGPMAVDTPFGRYNSIGRKEIDAAVRVLESGNLSEFLGTADPQFFGGPQIQALEKEWAGHFGCRFAVSVNSNTSGLIAAVGAAGVNPGDEVIVSPWTMSASATSILVWNAVPVFADIEEETFNLDPESVARNITEHTRAIVVPDIFGHPAGLDAIMDLASRYDLKVIEDSAQAPGARYKGRFVGTVADIGVFSLNYHKHIHTGEGGICVTDDPVLARRMELIRNHAESVVEEMGISDLSNMIGFNFRLTEIQAAIAREQLKKLDSLAASRQKLAEQLTEKIGRLDGLRPPVVWPGCSHVYYVYPILYDPNATGLDRAKLVEALAAEGIPIAAGYENLHLLPMYQKKTAYGTDGFPWSSECYKGHARYEKGICPVAEDLQERRFLQIGMCSFDFSGDDIRRIARGFEKVWHFLPEIERLGR